MPLQLHVAETRFTVGSIQIMGIILCLIVMRLLRIGTINESLIVAVTVHRVLVRNLIFIWPLFTDR